MSNPFATAAQPAAAANPFAGQPAAQAPNQAANPFGGQPAAQGQVAYQDPNAPAFQAPQGQPAAAAAAAAPGAMADPFAEAPPAPELDGLTKADAERGTVVILEIVGIENVTSKFPNQKTGEFEKQDRLTVNAIVVDGPKAGTVYADQWVFWNRIVGQFRDRAGDGRKYLVKLTMDGRAVTSEPVTDPNVRAQAARYIV